MPRSTAMSLRLGPVWRVLPRWWPASLSGCVTRPTTATPGPASRASNVGRANVPVPIITTRGVSAMPDFLDSLRDFSLSYRGYSRSPVLPSSEVSHECLSESPHGVHAHRVAGGDRHHRHPDRSLA